MIRLLSVPTYKYLRVTIDEKLHWSDHINNIKFKASKQLYFLKKQGQFKVEKCSLPFSTSFLLKVSRLYVLLVGKRTAQNKIV